MASYQNWVSQEEQDRVIVTLLNQSQWDEVPKVHDTPVTGTGLFPKPYLYYGVTGLNPNDSYIMRLIMVPDKDELYSDCHYDFEHTEPAIDLGFSRTGARWMTSRILFDTTEIPILPTLVGMRDIPVHPMCICIPVLEIFKREDGEWKLVCQRIFPNTTVVPVCRLNRPLIPSRPLHMRGTEEAGDQDSGEDSVDDFSEESAEASGAGPSNTPTSGSN